MSSILYNIRGVILSIEVCPKCKNEFESKTKYGDIKKFCSRKCANARVWKQEQRDKLSETQRRKKAEGFNFSQNVRDLDKWEYRNCKTCNKSFECYKKSFKNHCSLKCGTKLGGGYREGSGRAKSGYYKGIYCGSTYELAWVIYRLDHGLSVDRFEGQLISKTTGQKYIPDFIDGNIIIEIKGYELQNKVDIKTKIAESYGYEVIVLRKDDLKKEFEWIKNNYKTSELYVLYDNYKPEFEYICAFCNQKFLRNKKSKKEINYCCQICAGKGVAEINKKNKLKD